MVEKEVEFSFYTESNETSKRIYPDTRGQISYRKPAREEPTDHERLWKYCLFHELDDHNTNDCRHLHDLIEEYVRNN